MGIPTSCQTTCILNSLTFKEQNGTPQRPAANRQKLYVRQDGTFYVIDDTGAVREFGASGTVLSVDANSNSPNGLVITGGPVTTSGTFEFTLEEGLESIAGLATVADRMLYTTGPNVFALTSLSAFARTILDDANAAAVRSTIGAAQSGVNGDITQLSNPITFVDSTLFQGAVTLNVELFDSTNSPGADGDTLCSNGLATVWRQFLTIAGPGGPTITGGTAVPSAAEPDGSIYLRTDQPNGSLWVMENTVWVQK